MRVTLGLVTLAAAGLLAQGRGGQVPQGPQPARAVGDPHFEYVGPSSAGRIAAAAAVAGKPGELDRALAGLYKRMYDTELHFLSRTEMHSDDKWYVEKYQVYFNLIWLLAEIGGSGGDVMGGAGYAPTLAATGVFEDRLTDVQAGRSAFTTLMAEVERSTRCTPASCRRSPTG